MAIGAPVQLVAASTSTSSATFAVTTTVGAAGGALLVVLLSWLSGINLSSVSDSVGNTYTLGATQSATSNAHVGSAYCENAIAAPIGTVITATFSAAGTSKEAIAYSVSGAMTASSKDADTGASNISSTSEAVASPTLAQANELIFGWNRISGANGGFTQAPGFTTASAVGSMLSAYQITASTSPVTYGPSWVTSRANAANILSFKEASGGTGQGVGAATGLSIDLGVGKALTRGLGASPGLAGVLAVGRALARAHGTASGFASASAVGHGGAVTPSGRGASVGLAIVLGRGGFTGGNPWTPVVVTPETWAAIAESLEAWIVVPVTPESWS